MDTPDGARPDSTFGRGVPDPDLDGPSPRRRRLWRRRHGTYQGYQRLIANPFLALMGLIAWYLVVSQIVKAKRLILFWPALAVLPLVIFLFQFHCLDCGATGRLTRWRDHACEPVRLRYQAGFSKHVRLPTPIVQTTLWFYLVIVGLIFFYVILQ